MISTQTEEIPEVREEFGNEAEEKKKQILGKKKIQKQFFLKRPFLSRE
jgi:hypothetical protein